MTPAINNGDSYLRDLTCLGTKLFVFYKIESFDFSHDWNHFCHINVKVVKALGVITNVKKIRCLCFIVMQPCSSVGALIHCPPPPTVILFQKIIFKVWVVCPALCHCNHGLCWQWCQIFFVTVTCAAGCCMSIIQMIDGWSILEQLLSNR